MLMLILGLVILLGMHSVSIFAPGWRDAQAAARGEQVWKLIYGGVSLAGYLLIEYGWGTANVPPVVLYSLPPYFRHIAWLLMVPVFPLLLASYLPGRIATATKHPMLAAVKFWALAHLLANGSVASTVLFGSFQAWAVVDRISLKRRPHRATPGAPPGRYNDAIAIVGGLALYAAFLMGVHQWLIGVSPR